MSELLRTIVVMSVSGGILAGLLFALKPLTRNRIPKAAQYYLWLIVIAAFVIPFSKFVTLPAVKNESAAAITPERIVERYVVTKQEETRRVQTVQDNYTSAERESNTEQYSREVEAAQSPISSIVTVFTFYIYPLGVFVVLIYTAVSYYAYTRLHARRNAPARENEKAMLALLWREKHLPELYRNAIASTPMLTGLFRPAIILPDREYSEAQLRAVLLHELTHLRRKDVLIKWLSMLACAIHWFNPLAWLTRREIDRCGELACDEAVISRLDNEGKQTYGDTLIYVAADSKTPHAILATTMCEEKKALKSRLSAIMKSKKATKLAMSVSALMIVVSIGAAIVLGAGCAGSVVTPIQSEQPTVSPTVIQSGQPTVTPTEEPSEQPTVTPTPDYNYEYIPFAYSVFAVAEKSHYRTDELTNYMGPFENEAVVARSAQHIPVRKVDSVDSLSALLDDYNAYYTACTDYGYLSFAAVASQYDEAFFADNILLILFPTMNNENSPPELMYMRKYDSGAITAGVHEPTWDFNADARVLTWLICVEVQRSYLDSASSYDSLYDQ